MQVKIGVRFHRAEITYFKINKLYADYRLCQADSASRLNAKEFSFDKSSSVKQTKNVPKIAYFKGKYF